MEQILDQIKDPEQIKKLTPAERERLAAEIRSLIIRTVSRNGGHLASNLGVVELTIALLCVFEFPRDRVVFDVGHQAYTWKILTGRKEQFAQLRQLNGLAGFPKTIESPFDCFNTGHSSTSISAALGLSRAMAVNNRSGHAIAVIGDGALTGGMAFEALNDAGQSGENLIVILNDNQMSISKNVGGLSRHLEKLRISTPYLVIRSRFDNLMIRVPLLGKPILRLIRRIKQLARMTVQKQGIFFEQLGFHYYGPIDGHDLNGLIHHLRAISGLQGPVLLHVLTQKGRGYPYAEESPDLYHGVAPFVIEKGLDNGGPPSLSETPRSFSEAFGCHLVELARKNSRICAISAAMTSGTGLTMFSKEFPARFYDVGIAEQHAMTLAAGLASGGLKPFIALYSTFLQRAYDQLLHDVCLQELPVVVVVDRAGIVGEDGETHQGLYDLSLLLPLPNLEIFCPCDYASLRDILDYAACARKTVAIRYPRSRQWPGGILDSANPEDRIEASNRIRIHYLRKGTDVTIAALGTLSGPALSAARMLEQEQIDTEVIAVTCVKPLDISGLSRSVAKTGHVLFIEEALATGGFGQSALPELLAMVPKLRFAELGIEDKPLCQGTREQLLHIQHLDDQAIVEAVRRLVQPQ